MLIQRRYIGVNSEALYWCSFRGVILVFIQRRYIGVHSGALYWCSFKGVILVFIQRRYSGFNSVKEKLPLTTCGYSRIRV